MGGQHRMLHGYAPPLTVPTLIDNTHYEHGDRPGRREQIRGATMTTETRESSARSRFLGRQLRARQEAAGMTALDLAQRIGWAPSTVARLESGEGAVTLTGLASYLVLCDVLGAEQAELLDLAQAREDPWWSCPHDDKEPDELPALRYAVETANRVICWHPEGLPELVQAEAYGVWQLRVRHGAGADIAALWAERAARQDILEWPRPKQITCYLQESTLRSIPAHDGIRNAQLAHLRTLVALRRLYVRVLPTRRDHCLPVSGRFWLFGFAGFPPVVCAQSDLVSTFGQRKRDIASYESILYGLDELALSGQDSVTLIERLGDQHRAAGRSPNPAAS